MSDNELKEALAKMMHDVWAHWMRYQFSQCIANDDGSATIPFDKYLRWQRQMNTPFNELTASEQLSDYDVAKEHAAAILAHIEAQDKRIAELEANITELESVNDGWKSIVDQML